MRAYQLILCMPEFLHYLQHEIRKVIPKDAPLFYGLWELACECHVLINAKTQACLKSIGNDAKKPCLG